jgi:GlpG protein
VRLSDFTYPRLPRFTILLMGLCAVVALASQLGSNIDPLRPLLISEYVGAGLPEVRSGEVWRLITPIFIHFGIIHLLFNMLWLWDLGGGIEYRLGVRALVPLVLVIGVLSNLAQYLFGGPGFGGMSGVVYGLLGYVWMLGRYHPRAGLVLHQQVVAMMLIWFVLCWTGLLGPIANMAHTVGLVLGTAWGRAVAWRAAGRHQG